MSHKSLPTAKSVDFMMTTEIIRNANLIAEVLFKQLLICAAV